MEEFKEVVNKKGKTLVFCDLEEYTQGFIDDLLYDEDEKDFHVECPHCLNAYKTDSSYDGPYTKRKLYVAKDFSIGHCFRCDRIFINTNERINLNVDLSSYDITQQEFSLVKLNGSDWNLDLFDAFKENDDEGFEYLVTKRHKYMRQLKSVLKIRFLNHNPVIPFFYRGQLIYFQIKRINAQHGQMPYFSPPITHKPPYIIEHGDNRKFVICEGVFDAIACLILYPDRTPFAVLGSTITDYQIAMLRTYLPSDILVQMDNTELSKNVAARISKHINYANISLHPSSGLDPEEILKLDIANKLESE